MTLYEKTCIYNLANYFISTVIVKGSDPGLLGDDPDVPLDGGVSLLLAAGVVYGLKKMRQLKP